MQEETNILAEINILRVVLEYSSHDCPAVHSSSHARAIGSCFDSFVLDVLAAVKFHLG